MIRGTVNHRNEAVVPLRLRGPSGIEIDIDVVIDTAFTGLMTLPSAIISALNLTFRTYMATILGDGTTLQLNVYDVELEWDGVWISARASEIGKSALIGTELLAGHDLFIEFVSGGVVDITKI